MSGKPYLAMDGHKGSVRVLLPVKTMATISSSRVDQFLSDEQRRMSVVSQLDDYEDSEGLRKLAALMENKDTEGRAEIGVEGEENEEGRDGILAEREENGAGGTEIQLQNVTSLVNDVPVLEENGVKQNELDGSLTPPFPLTLPPTDIQVDDGSAQITPQTVEIMADIEPDHQSPEEEVLQVQPVQQVQQVQSAAESEEQNHSSEVNEGLAKTIAEEEEDKVTQEKTGEEEGEEPAVLNGSREVQVEKLVDIDENEAEPPYEFGDAEKGIDEAGENLYVNRTAEDGVPKGEPKQPSNGSIEESGIYSVPFELDRRPQSKMKKDEKENIYAIPHEILPARMRQVIPANYEAPSKLNETGELASLKLDIFVDAGFCRIFR